MTADLRAWRSCGYTPLRTLKPEKTRVASDTLCKLFNVPSLCDYQVQAGQNALLGKNTFLDIPTGGGKTLAFYYSLFYHWQPGITLKKAQKIILVLGPISRLLASQAKSLQEIGVPAVSMTGEAAELETILRVGLFDLLLGFV